MGAIFKREIRSYFLSPLGYIFMGAFILISGILFVLTNILQQSSNYNNVLGSLIYLFMLLVPILTMRLLSEERKSKTDQLLLTSPVSILSIVLGKFFAAAVVFLATLVVTFVFPAVLFAYGTPSLAKIVGGYVGFFFMGCCFISIGLFISSLTENQVTAAVVTYAVLLVVWILDSVVTSINNQAIVKIIQWLSLINRYQNFSLGIFSFSPIIYYISFSGVFIFLTMRAIEKRRWGEA